MFTPQEKSSGMTLVELLLSMAIMAIVLLSLGISASKITLMGNSLEQRNWAVVELQSLYFGLRNSIAASSGVIPQSLNNRLILTNTDSSGNAYLTAYQITGNQLKLSTSLTSPADQSTGYGSPYSISAASGYTVTGEFLYCGYNNNCTRFVDTNGNGVFDSGIDTATLATGSGSALASPDQARRVLLYNLKFDKQYGNPSVVRTFPNTYITIGSRYVDAGPPLSWGAAPAVQSFSTSNASNSTFNSGFTAKAISYDSLNKRLLLTGTYSSGNQIYLVTRLGIGNNDITNNMTSPVTVSGLPTALNSLAVENGSNTAALALDAVNNKIWEITLSGSGSASSVTLPVGNAGNIVTATAKSIAYDPSTSPVNYSNSVFVLAKDFSSGNWKIFEYPKSSTAATPTSTLSLPAGYDGTNATAMFMEPVTGDFYIISNVITTSGSDNVLTVNHVSRSSSTTADTFQVNLTKIGSSTSGSGNNFGLAYEFISNHLFLLDTTAGKIFEVTPTRLLSPHN